METQERCPWCNSTIPRTKFLEFQERIRREERKNAEAAEGAARKRLEAEYQQKLDAQRKAAEKEAAGQIKVLAAERDVAMKKTKEMEAREAAVKKEAQTEAEKQAKKLLDQAEKERQKEVGEVRTILEKDRERALAKKEAEFRREREGLQKKMKDMERRLQKKTANEIGDGAEVDLVEVLREEFPDDRITRVQKGQAGADVWQDVIYKGQVCGRIIFDSKNRQAWQNSFAAKLRQDQIEAKADHALLSSVVFPAGKKELCIEQGVIVISPGHVVYIVEILRTSLIKLWCLGLSTQARTGKMSRLYQFISSDAFMQKLQETGTIVQDALDLEVEEKKQHDKVWKRRGLLLVRQKNLLRDMDTEIGAILEGTEEGEARTA